jgi:uncharacterized membrane protein (DUF485 family)
MANRVKAVVVICFVGLAAIVAGGTAGWLFGIALLAVAAGLATVWARRAS